MRTKYIDKKKPVLISNKISDWGAISKWNPEYFESIAPDLSIITKKFGSNDIIQKESSTLAEYVRYLQSYTGADCSYVEDSGLLYWHDVPLLHEIPELSLDIDPFFLNVIPKWYSYKWWRYLQFFVGPKGSVTPLHFDCLYTNNLFFQIYGRKKFILLAGEDAKYCSRYGWRWFKVDPENPNFDEFPEFQHANPIEVIVEPGDILYMPAGTLHYVKSLSTSISFNIDFHTRNTLLRSFKKSFKGMPLQNSYYNSVCALGIIGKIPSKYLFKYYRSYLNYIS